MCVTCVKLTKTKLIQDANKQKLGVQQDVQEDDHWQAVSGGPRGFGEGRQDGSDRGAAEGGPEHQQVPVCAGRRNLGAFHKRKVRPLQEQQAHTGTWQMGRGYMGTILITRTLSLPEAHAGGCSLLSDVCGSSAVVYGERRRRCEPQQEAP